MRTSRRDFLRTSAAAGGAFGLGLGLPADRASLEEASAATVPVRPTVKPLRILILGGTGFIGPHEVRYAQQRGHTLTLFNRGKTNPGLFPEIEKLEGDRAVGNYEALKGREWDVVIDNPTMLPRWVRGATAVLKGHAKHYIFVSTISVYARHDLPDRDESDPVATTDEPDREDDRSLYGPLKALCEQETRRAFPDHATIIRPGLIVGPGDLTDRFTYWPARLARGGEVLAPGAPTDPCQIIDARDLAAFIIHCCEDAITGVYNCLGPQSPLTMAELLGGIRAAMSTDAWLTWVDADFLAGQKVQPWLDMPVWFPPRGEMAGASRRSNRAALARGLTFRPLADTAKGTLDFYDREPEDRKAKLRAGLDAAREVEVLAAWHASRKGS